MNRITLKEYAKAKVYGKRITLWKALIFAMLASMVASFFTLWLDEPIPTSFYTINDMFPYIRTTLISSVITMFFTTPMQYGINQYFMDFDKDDIVDNNVIFAPYRHIIKIFVISLFVGFVCTLPMMALSLVSIVINSEELLLFALFIGGLLNFYLSLSFAAIPYIFNENSDKSIIEIMKISAQMMKGNKMDFFVLSLSFIGWYILSFFTCGILMLWVLPYTSFTFAKFFLNIKESFYGNDNTHTSQNEFTIG